MHPIPLLLLLSAALALGACTGPTIAGYGAGSDAAYLNASRGRADAQISSVQAEAYARQQDMVAREMALEQQKRRNFMENTQGTLNLVNSLLR